MIDTKALRKKILDLAMHGKLVEQDQEDDSANELLASIKEKKEIAILKKRMQNDKNFLKITEKEQPYEIPEEWVWARLSSISKDIFAGGDKPKEYSRDKNEKYNVPIFANGATKLSNKKACHAGCVKSKTSLSHTLLRPNTHSGCTCLYHRRVGDTSPTLK